jgi:hypothetical protein
MSVVNPVFTHEVPYRCVASVDSDEGGGLLITTTQADRISAFGFAGSVTDALVGSTDKTVARIRTELKERRAASGQGAAVVRRLTRAWVADACTFGMFVCFVLAMTMADG